MHSGNDQGLLTLYNRTPMANPATSLETREAVANEVIDQIHQEVSTRFLQHPTAEERVRIQERINALVGLAYRRHGQIPSPGEEIRLSEELGRRLMGLGFLDLMLPPARNDLSEICITSRGLVLVMKKNQIRWKAVPELQPDASEISRVLDRLLGPQNKTLNEANPSVNAKLPASPHNPGGGRIKALHPVLVPPGRNPAINIRLFEPKPVLPQWILEREMMSPEMMDLLGQAVAEGYRILITGGTRTGKTTLLSALCSFLPSDWRIIKIEDPEEIWIDRDNVQTIEARPAALGTQIWPYTLANGVDDALRMGPDYLIVGEVRDGLSALSLFRAMMTGHPGACTFHADHPREAVRRLATVLGADAGVRPSDAGRLVAEAVDLLVQLGIRSEVRRVTLVANVTKRVRLEEVGFDPIFRFDDQSSATHPQWTRVGSLGARITAETSL